MTAYDIKHTRVYKVDETWVCATSIEEAIEIYKAENESKPMRNDIENVELIQIGVLYYKPDENT